MGRLTLTRRVGDDDKTSAVFSKGSGSFSVRAHENAGDRTTAGDEND